MEGVPEWVGPAETPGERLARSARQERGYRLFEMAGALLPGLSLALALAVLGTGIANWIGSVSGFEKTPVSPVLIAILLGLAIRNTVGLPGIYELGLQLCLRRILRIGVALLGIRLGLAALGSIGLLALPIVAVCIATALVLVNRVSRALGLPPRLGTLVAVGTAICGNTAIVATGPAIGADEDEISYAVGCITVFGLVALVTYPFLSHWMFPDAPELAGLFLGTAIHDTAQVVGAGMLYVEQFGDARALDVATVTKLVRNLFMIAVIPLVAVLHHRGSDRRANVSAPRLGQVVPLFVLGFVAMALLRTLGDLGREPFGGLLSREGWSAAIEWVAAIAGWCLAMAMASVGLGTHLQRLRTLGWRPLAVGFAAAVTVGGVSALLIKALG